MGSVMGHVSLQVTQKTGLTFCTIEKILINENFMAGSPDVNIKRGTLCDYACFVPFSSLVRLYTVYIPIFIAYTGVHVRIVHQLLTILRSVSFRSELSGQFNFSMEEQIGQVGKPRRQRNHRSNLVSRPRHRLQYGKVGRTWYLFSRQQ